MRNRIRRKKGDNHPIGTFKEDFSKCCKDCMERDDVGNFTFIQCYWRVVPDSEPEWIETIEDGKIRKSFQYPTETYDYCYWHCKERGLLPYQQKGGK